MDKRKRRLSMLGTFVMMFSLLTSGISASAEEENEIPQDAAVLAEQTVESAGDPLHVAAYYNTVPSLPETVDGEAVAWPELYADEFTELYSVIEITGTKEDGNTVTASVEVVPENLVYFIDSGTGTEWQQIMAGTSDASAARNLTSLSYLAVKNLVGEGLLNEVSDQYYSSERSWGVGYTPSTGRADPIQTYWNNNVAPADGSEITNKYAAGLRASNNTNFEYYLTLDAGTYTLTTGFHEFYNGNHNRGMTPKIYDAADDTLIAAFDTVLMSNNANSSAAPDIISSGTFTLEKQTLIKVHYEKNSGENGSMNWLAVCSGELPGEVVRVSDLRNAVSEARSLDLNIYATHSQTLLTHALNTAETLLADTSGTVTQEQVDQATAILNAVKDSMAVKDENPNRYSSVPVGEAWLDTEGDLIQAHGGGFLQQTDTDGKPIYYWAGEDKAHNTSNFNGISLYSSKDLLNWTYRGTILQPDAMNDGLSNNKIERPKLVYNEATQKYVLWGHWEDKSGYSSSQICVATCDTVDGDYEFLGHWRPGADEEHRNWRVSSSGAQYDDGTPIDDYSSDEAAWGTGSRDFTIFVDGTDAYLLSAQDHLTMRIYKLNDSFTDVDEEAMESYQLFNGGRREAPALVKSGEYYFMISSAQSGWYPNQTRYSYTKDITDPNGWAVVDPSSETKMPVGYLGNNTTFYSQPTNIMTITGSETNSYVYMGDRWNSKALGSSTYVWLPLTFEGLDTDTPEMSMDYQSGWSLDTETGSVVVPENKLISQGKPASTDAQESNDDALKLANANDGEYINTKTTGGNHAYFKPVTQVGGNDAKVPFTYMIDLEDVYDLSRLDISFNCWNGSECYYQYTVDTSMNGTDWAVAADESGNTTVGFKSHELSGLQARYVRLSVSKVVNAQNGSSASWAAGLVEVQVYGKEETEENPVNLSVKNGTIVSGAEDVSEDGTRGTAAEKTVVTVKANNPAEGQVFQYWTADGVIVSYDAEYSFYYMEKGTLALEAVYGEKVPEVTALIRITESDADPDTLKVSFVSERNLPEGSTIKSHGIILSSNEPDEENFVIGGKGVKKSAATTKGLNGTYKVNIKVKKGAALYARGYVIYTDAEGTEHTIYSAAASQKME